MKISVIYNHKDKKHNLFIIMQCKLFKNKGEDFMLKSIRKFFSMILPICMLVTTAPCIISTAEGKTVDFSIVNSDNVEFRVSEDRKTIGFFYNDEPSAYSLQSGEGNNGPIATLLSANNNVTFSKNKMLDSGFTATSSDGANFTLKLKVTDDAKKQGWMGAMDPFEKDGWNENPIYGSEKSCDVTKDDANNKFSISLTKGKYIEIEKPSGDFDLNFNTAINVNYEGKYLPFTEENGYTLTVPDGGATLGGQDSELKVTVKDGTPFTCVEKICEGTGIGIEVTDGGKSYTLSGTGTCKLRFKDNRKGIWLAGTDGSECGYVEVSTYANDKDRANDIIMGEREIVKAGEYYYSAEDKSVIVHAKFVPYDGRMTDDSGMGSVALDDDAFKKLGDGEKNANEEHYLTYNIICAKKIENFGDYFVKTESTTTLSGAVQTKLSGIKAESADKTYNIVLSDSTKGEQDIVDHYAKTIYADKDVKRLFSANIEVKKQYDSDSDGKKVTETEDDIWFELTLNDELIESAEGDEGVRGVYIHDGKSKDLTVSTYKNKIIFLTNEFSTYGFYVVSKKAENDVIANNVASANNLKTGEDASYLTFLGVLLVTGGWLFILSKRKNKILK